MQSGVVAVQHTEVLAIRAKDLFVAVKVGVSYAQDAIRHALRLEVHMHRAIAHLTQSRCPHRLLLAFGPVVGAVIVLGVIGVLAKHALDEAQHQGVIGWVYAARND